MCTQVMIIMGSGNALHIYPIVVFRVPGSGGGGKKMCRLRCADMLAICNLYTGFKDHLSPWY